MKRNVLFTMRLVAIAMLACTLTACPPKNSNPNDPTKDPPPQEEPPNNPEPEDSPKDPPSDEPEKFVVSDYWPFAVGNHWLFRTETGETQYTYDVVEDHSTPEVPAWALKLSTLDEKGIVIQEETLYFVQMKHFLMAATDQDAMAKLIEFADGDFIPDLGDKVEIIAPSHFQNGNGPDDFVGDRFILTGPLADLLQYFTCPQADSAFDPIAFPAPADHHCMVTLFVAKCITGEVLFGEMLFARDIGPLVAGKGTLQYAKVNGVEFARPID